MHYEIPNKNILMLENRVDRIHVDLSYKIYSMLMYDFITFNSH